LHSVIKFGIIIWGNSSNSGKIFTLQKKIIIIIAIAQPELHVEVYLNSYRLYLFHASIYFHLNFIINDQETSQINSCMPNINARNKHKIHAPNANLSCFQVSIFYAGMKIFNILPPSMTPQE
jgi:hypothetical protein